MKSFENQLIITNIFLGFKQTMIHVIVISEIVVSCILISHLYYVKSAYKYIYIHILITTNSPPGQVQRVVFINSLHAAKNQHCLCHKQPCYSMYNV